MDATAGSSIIRNLASCNKSTRDRALRDLQSWLPEQSHVSTDDMKLIWKGLFYCVWHSDKAPVQAELIDRLSSQLLNLHLPLVVEYFSVFLFTVRREWSGIDVLRLDKFYLLIRRFVFNLFMLLKHNSWDLDAVNRLVLVFDQQTEKETVQDAVTVERNRIENRKRAIVKLKDKYLKELDRWSILSNSLSALEQRHVSIVTKAVVVVVKTLKIEIC